MNRRSPPRIPGIITLFTSETAARPAGEPRTSRPAVGRRMAKLGKRLLARARRVSLSMLRSMDLRTTLPGILLLGLLAMAGCAVNPVTGEKQLSLISTRAEIAAGDRHYVPLQQAGGGLYTVDSALTKYVERVGQRVAAVSDRALPYEFVVLNATSPNAWALPGGKIAITRGLLVELDNEAELAAVLGHEVVHAAAKHSVQAMQRGMLGQLVMVGAAVALQNSDYGNFVLGTGNLGLQAVGQKYSRDAEREADDHGMKYMHAAGYDTAAAVTLQEKFVALAKGRRPGWLEGLFASHPASTERVANNRAALAKFPAGGTLGRAAYEKRIAYLRARKGAYKEADRARRLLRRSPERALRAIDGAIRQEPREPLFRGIRGRILMRQKRYQDAVRAYDAAIKRDAGYYGHYLGRGLVYRKLGRRTRARNDLERSNTLLRTAAATYALGRIALADGERAHAKRLFGAASNTRTELGKLSREAYVKLDIDDAPGRYVSANAFVSKGRIVVKVTNSTRHEIRDIVVRIDAAVNGAKLRPRLRQIPRLRANAFTVLRTGIRHREKDKVDVRARILRARAAS